MGKLTHTCGDPYALSKVGQSYVIRLHGTETAKTVALSFNLLKHFNYYSVNTQIPGIRPLMYYFDTIRPFKYFLKSMDKLTFHNFCIRNFLLQQCEFYKTVSLILGSGIVSYFCSSQWQNCCGSKTGSVIKLIGSSVITLLNWHSMPLTSTNQPKKIFNSD